MQLNYIIRTQCDICGSKDLVNERKIEDFDQYLGFFDLLYCNNCGAYFTSPYPDDNTLPNLYTNRDSKNFDNDNSFFFNFIKGTMARWEVKKYVKFLNIDKNSNFSILDFGTGNGRYACALLDIFPNAHIWGVDFAPEAPKTYLGYEKKIEYIQTSDFFSNSAQYDLCYLRHVLEHVDQPLSFIAKVLTKIKNGGHIIIEVPNIKNGLTNIFPQYSPSFYPPYHIHHFTQENIVTFFDSLSLSLSLSLS